jgi:hypothetical protein
MRGDKTMLRSAGLVVAMLVLVVGGQAGTGAASQQDLLVSGKSTIAMIDADNDGGFDDDDCFLSAKMDADGSNLATAGEQPSGPDKLRVCDGGCTGSGLASMDFLEVMLNTCEFAAGPFVPMLADFCTSASSCESSTAMTAGVGRPAGAEPLNIVAGTVFRTFFGPQNVGGGQVCSAGGPTAQITGEDGVTVLRSLLPLTIGDDSFLCASQVPVQLVSGPFVFRTACFPVRNGAADLALSGTPDAPFAVIPFDSLAACSGRGAPAPTVSEWGLIGLMMALLAAGTWLLARRSSFAAALPLR